MLRDAYYPTYDDDVYFEFFDSGDVDINVEGGYFSLNRQEVVDLTKVLVNHILAHPELYGDLKWQILKSMAIHLRNDLPR